jgi:predicted ester cyclase
MSEANEASVRRAVAAFNDPSSRDGYLDLYAPQVVLHGYPEAVQGKDGARSFYSELWAAFPDARLSLDEMIANDDRLAARYTLTGIQAQDFYGAPLTTAATRIEGMTWLHFRDGQVVEEWQLSGTPDTLTRLSARAARTPPRHSASADAAALRWEETHPEP